MTRLPTLSAAQVIKALLRAGFEVQRQVGSHVVLFNSKTEKQTVVPQHGGDLKRGLMKAILKQCELSEEEFRELI